MNNIVREIITIVVTAIVFEISNRIFKKYKIRERRITFLVSVLLFLGLFFIIYPLVLLIAGFQRGDIVFLSVLIFGAAMFFGVLLLVIMVWIIVRKEEIYPEDTGILKIPPVKGTKVEKRPVSSRALSIIGFFIVAACVYLFVAFGPQNDPPGMSPEHIQTDIYINYLCASVAFIGLVLLIVGQWKSLHKPPTSPIIYPGSGNSKKP